MMTTTLDQLRDVLAPTFPETEPVLRQMREVGLIPGAGQDGAGSAPITEGQAVLIMLALAASGTAPSEASAMATALADYRLCALCVPEGAGMFRQEGIDSDLCFSKWAVEVFHRAVEPGFHLLGWTVRPGQSILAIESAADSFRPRPRAVPASEPPERVISDADQQWFVNGRDTRPGSPDFPEPKQPGLLFAPGRLAEAVEGGRRFCDIKPELIRAVAALFSKQSPEGATVTSIAQGAAR